MPLKIAETQKTVTTAGSSVQLSLTSFTRQVFIILALDTNLGTIYIGDSNVTASTGLGFPLTSGEEVTLDAIKMVGTNELIDLTLLFADSTASGDKVTISYFEREK